MSENIFVDKTTTWHAIGKSVAECKSMEQVLKASGLDYTVEKNWVYGEVNGEMIDIPNRFVTTRNTDGHMYDIVSDKYEVIQNRDAFDFVDYMGNELQFEKAGETAGGMVYIIGKLPSVKILDDEFTPHVIFRNGFNGKIKITAAIVPLRLVCQNQFNFAFKDAQNAVTIRHTANAEVKLAEAKEVLKMSADYMEKINAIAEQYVSQNISEFELHRILNIMFPIDGIEEMNPYKRKTLETARENFIKAYDAEDNRNFRGTAWGLVNAYTDFITHKVPQGNSETKEEGKFINTTFKVGGMNRILRIIEWAA